MRSGRPDGIAARRIDSGHEIGRAIVTRQECCTIKSLGDVLLESTEHFSTNVGEIAAPARVVALDVTMAIAGGHAETGERCKDAVTHELADAHCSVVSAGHRVSDARIASPHAQSVWQAHTPLELGGLTE